MTPTPIAAKVANKAPALNLGKPSASDEDIYRVPETINFPGEEEKTLKFWGDNKVFEQCVQQSKGKPKYVTQ